MVNEEEQGGADGRDDHAIEVDSGHAAANGGAKLRGQHHSVAYRTDVRWQVRLL